MQCSAFDIPCYLTWIFEEIEIFFLWVFGSILDAFVSLIDLIPLPDFLENLETYTIPDSVSFFVSFMNVDFGLSVITSAYIARFIIRRLPVVG